MVVDKVLGNCKDFPIGDRKTEKVFLEWFELDKKLLRKTTEAGEEIGIRLEEHGHGHLHEGDILYVDTQKVIVVDLLPCELTVVNVNSMKEMGRLCFELGNRHLSLAITDTQVSVPYDEPTFSYLVKLGFTPERVTEKFSHFTVCHAHGHTHTHAHEGEAYEHI